jgi:HD-GYP domain-containing protein (c-di-GMP phosphodiesterase class II)
MAELCAATSLFTDLGTGQPTDHALRTCVVAMRLAERLQLDDEDRRTVYYATLLRFLGCTADQHQVAAEVGGDEIAFFAGSAPSVMGSSLEELRRMVGLVAPGQSLPRRARLLLALLSDPKGKDRLLAAHCEVAATLALGMGLDPPVVEALRAAYARWDGGGTPSTLEGEAIPVATRIAIVARDVELWSRDVDEDTAVEVVQARRAKAYDPSAVDAALDGSTGRLAASHLAELRRIEGDPWEVALGLEPGEPGVLDGSRLTSALAALGDLADLKAPEFSGHSRRTARLACRAATAEGVDPELVERAALTHDVGVVAVPSGLWCAPRRFTASEWEQVRLHPMWTNRILARCRGLDRVGALAGSTHERLDGSGYPTGARGGAEGWAVLAAADAFDEHCSPRSYRPAATPGDAADRLGALVEGGRLPHAAVAAVLDAAGEAPPMVTVDRPAGLTEREVDVLRLLARGRTNRQIATDLRISPKTVGAHVEHLYAKAGVRSRAAATLFAMQHDLIA